MFALAVILVILICAVPLTVAAIAGFHFVGMQLVLAVLIALGMAVTVSALIVKHLVLKNNKQSA